MRATFSLCLSMAAAAALGGEKPALRPKVCPTPVRAEIAAADYVPLRRLTLSCGDAQAADWVRRHLSAWYGRHMPELAVGGGPIPEGPEEYLLSADAGGVRMSAGSLAGARWAMQTLRQLAIPERGTEKVEGWIVPVCRIDDCPAMAFRAMHVCWFPETAEWQVERLVRLAGAYKMNYVVLEPWGTFDSRVAPWYAWSGQAKMTKPVLARLRVLAADLGVTLVPQLNVFGHATMSRVAAGKHAALDFHPEYQPLFEPMGGWNWCLTNPATRKLLVALIGELCEAFGNPPYFHLGCDEANPPSCPDCMKRPYSEILLEHVRAMNDAVAARGAKSMMWHDQLLEQGDERWKGFYAYGTRETAAAAKGLPKDIVICDWHYAGPKTNYPTMKYFSDLGFKVVTCPWQDKDGIAAQGAFARTNGLFGVMGTYWHHFHGQNLPKIAVNTACAAWGTPLDELDRPWNHVRFMNDLRRIGWDMNAADYDRTGVYMKQTVPVSAQDD
ncbi:MAG: family 20 glycosylhydrolase [Kiritimatiellae bacterium]|nr:family 20 glycosylhydrolase [Kiritimatiellia bacterium]